MDGFGGRPWGRTGLPPHLFGHGSPGLLSGTTGKSSLRASAGPLSGLRDRVRSLGGAGATIRARQRWVQRATDGECEVVNAEDWRRIVAEVCEAGDAGWLERMLRERPVLSDHVVAFRALVLIHRVLQHGPSLAVSEWTSPGGLLESVGKVWEASAQAAALPAQVQHCVQAVAEYTQVLATKAELMQEGDAGRGRFDGSMVYSQVLLEPSDLLQALAMLLSFAERLMPLALHLVVPSKEWRRLERSQYMRLYLGAVFALLDEAWLLLCAVSLFVKNLLCQVHAAKQCEAVLHGSDGSRPWLQLSLHLLAAQPRFARFHAAICDFVAHCHQLRCAGFPELGAHIPMVPQGLLNLFAGLEELVNNPATRDAECGVQPGSSLSSATTTAGSVGKPSSGAASAKAPADAGWEPSPCVLDALRTVDRLQQSPLLTGHYGSGSSHANAAVGVPVAATGTATSVGPGPGPGPGPLYGCKAPSRPASQARGYVLLDEESDAGEPLVPDRSRGRGAEEAEEAEADAEALEAGAEAVAVLDAGILAFHDRPKTPVQAQPQGQTPTQCPQEQSGAEAGAGTRELTEEEMPVEKIQLAPCLWPESFQEPGPEQTTPAAESAVPAAWWLGDGHQPNSWATAICRQQLSRAEASAASQSPLFTSPLWEPPASAAAANLNLNLPQHFPAEEQEPALQLSPQAVAAPPQPATPTGLKGAPRPVSPVGTAPDLSRAPLSARATESPKATTPPLNPFELSTAQLQRASGQEAAARASALSPSSPQWPQCEMPARLQDARVHAAHAHQNLNLNANATATATSPNANANANAAASAVGPCLGLGPKAPSGAQSLGGSLYLGLAPPVRVNEWQPTEVRRSAAAQTPGSASGSASGSAPGASGKKPPSGKTAQHSPLRQRTRSTSAARPGDKEAAAAERAAAGASAGAGGRGYGRNQPGHYRHRATSLELRRDAGSQPQPRQLQPAATPQSAGNLASLAPGPGLGEHCPAESYGLALHPRLEDRPDWGPAAAERELHKGHPLFPQQQQQQRHQLQLYPRMQQQQPQPQQHALLPQKPKPMHQQLPFHLHIPEQQSRQQQPPQCNLVPNEWEVDPAELRLEELLGSGSTAEVFRGSWHGTDVAVKKLRQSGPLSTEFTREISVLLRFRHPNLVLFMGASTQGPPLIISEYCAGGTVFALLHQRLDMPLPWSQRLKVAIDVAKGMNFLHRRQVVHRDLKSLNLLLAGPVECHEDIPAVKVSDFGLSRAWLPEQSKSQVCMTSGAGTYHWMAPEVLDGQWYNEKVDVYSYGICLFELVARRIPYDGSGLEPVSIAVAVSRGRRPDAALVPQDCPADLRFTMECCWAHCPTGRPGFDTILETLKLVQCP